jgi:hypothetical protein
MKLKFNYIKVDKFNIKQNGIQIIETENTVEIYNDTFRTIPLFITKDKSSELIIFSNFEEYYSFENIDKSIDEAGFWEIVLFGSGLWTRTLYKNVEQMPAASKIIIDKNTNEYKIERYWDFNIEVDESIDSIEKAAQGLYDRLDSIFSKLDKNQKYIMGMSGGMDSRITLAFLSKYIPKENLELFTYGFDERLLEYKYACEVAEALGYNKPKFHKLTKYSYIKAFEYLPKQSGGQIGINHCHILDYLKNNDIKENIQISTYYSDAIFGWDSVYPKNIENIEDNFYIKLLKNINFISDEIKEQIKIDSLKIFSNFDNNANYSSLDEYKYVTERNQKFHNYLAFIQSQLIKNELIYTNYELLTYILSIPIKYRAQKRLVDYILDNYLKNISSRDFKNISSRFQWGSKFSGQIEFYWFKYLNRVNAVLRPLTKGHIQLFNKYQTEEQDRILYRDLHPYLKKATSKFVELGLMSEEQKNEWDKLPLRNAGIGERFGMISLGKLI